ncbi:hypothetical protein OG373_39430 [Streptomyces avidinii]|uniref:hypothetical protein n=1 Tax=Streptomyces avidinii TaxID=1895 RepID=UPI00386DE894|nr:hypothetical protein OG373_39430 [Streptomyces avidinii]
MGPLNVTNDARYAVPAYPFEPPPAAAFRDRLHELEPAGAVTALAVIVEEWGDDRPVRNRPERDALLADARFLLDRYGSDAQFWTNARDAASDPARDFVRAGLKGTRVRSFITCEYINGLDLLEELGLIAVSGDGAGSSGPSARTDTGSPGTQTRPALPHITPGPFPADYFADQMKMAARWSPAG